MVVRLFLLLAYITSNPDAAEGEELLFLTGLIHRSYLIEIARKSALEWFTAFLGPQFGPSFRNTPNNTHWDSSHGRMNILIFMFSCCTNSDHNSTPLLTPPDFRACPLARGFILPFLEH